MEASIPTSRERDRAGISRSRSRTATSLSRISWRSTPRPPARNAITKPMSSARHMFGSTASVRASRARVPAIAAYGPAIDSAARYTYRSRGISQERASHRPDRYSSSPGSRTRPIGSRAICPSGTENDTW